MNFLEFLKKNTEAEKGKVDADKIFVRSIAVSFLAAMVCIVMLSASTYAWFSRTIESTETIETSVYILEISAEPGATVTEENGKTYYTLAAGTEYTVTATAIANDQTNGRTGYFKIVIGDTTYISQQIDRGDQLQFTLIFDAETKIEIIECWGTSITPDSERHIHQGDSFTNMVKTN